ncbi:MAG TPA: hypothetical protein VGQ59_17030, partial [Cyclobacteriaceae bacterium]|nr:hypothetical protein [Cyclobacteriaceae bacterium]
MKVISAVVSFTHSACRKSLFVVIMITAMVFLFGSCLYNNTAILQSSNIVLHDKPLEVIRVNVQGRWRLLLVVGGVSGGTFPVKNNPYMEITGDHIIGGNDLGINLDTTIVWTKGNLYYGQDTYLLTYRN